MKDFRNSVPIVLSVAFLGIILTLALRKFSAWDTGMAVVGWLLVLSYIVWLFAESKVAVGEVGRDATTKDRGTCEAYASGRALVVMAALYFPTAWKELNVVMMTGLLIFIAGVAFRLVAIRTLGQFYSHRVRITQGHKIIDHGPYRWVRHPAYTGMLMAHLGVVVMLFNGIALAMLLLVLLPAMVARILIEERALFELSGYSEYARNHRRLLPLIW